MVWRLHHRLVHSLFVSKNLVLNMFILLDKMSVTLWRLFCDILVPPKVQGWTSHGLHHIVPAMVWKRWLLLNMALFWYTPGN